MDRTAESYDAVAGEYAARFQHELDHKPFDRALLNAFAEELQGKGLVADIGCGPGHLAAYLHNLGLQTVGIDLSPGMIETARRLNPDLPYTVGNMLDLDVQEGTWAGIIAFYSIIHISPADLPRVFAGFHRALQPGGLLLISFHVGDERVHRDEWWEKPVSLDFQFFQTAALEAMLRQAGFHVLVQAERAPYVEIEYPSRRGYLLAGKG